MAKAWIVDLWVKDASVSLPGGSVQKITPSSAQLKAVTKIPEHFRTARYGRGKRWKHAWYEDQDGKQVQRSKLFAAKKDAEELKAELEDDIRSGRYIDPAQKARLFRDAAEVWLGSKQGIKDSSWRRYKRELDNYVNPKWGSTPVGNITREKIDAWVAELVEGTAPYKFSDSGKVTGHKRKPGKMSPAYVRHIVGRTFGGTLKYIVKQGWIGRDPSDGVELPRLEERDKEKLPSLGYDEAEALTQAIFTTTGREDDLCLAMVLLYGGARIGEATAFRVENFHSQKRRVRVEQTWTVDREGKRVLGVPKGWEKRWVPLPIFVTDQLSQLVKDRAPDEFLFQTARGEAINDRNWYNRVWVKARESVPAAQSMSVHDLRHVAATFAIGASADVKLVQQMLGHKDATETLNTYSTLWKDNLDSVARKIEKRRAKALRQAAAVTEKDVT